MEPSAGIEFRVYAQFPKHVAREPPIDLDPNNWQWHHCLTFPASEISHLSEKLVKWLRFSVGVVAGAPGDLCFCELDPFVPGSVIDNDFVPTESIDLCYVVPDERKQSMFPFDPKFLNPKALTSSATTTGCGGFRDTLECRDGTCVLTDLEPWHCDAAHIVGHSKNDVVWISFILSKGLVLTISSAAIQRDFDKTQAASIRSRRRHGQRIEVDKHHHTGYQ